MEQLSQGQRKLCDKEYKFTGYLGGFQEFSIEFQLQFLQERFFFGKFQHLYSYQMRNLKPKARKNPKTLFRLIFSCRQIVKLLMEKIRLVLNIELNSLKLSDRTLIFWLFNSNHATPKN